MKKIIFTLVLLFSSEMYSQIDISGGMGISFFHSASMTDYLEVNFSGGEKQNSFNSSAEFFLEGDININPHVQLGLEYAFSIYSYNKILGITNYDISMSFHKPSILGYYVFPGKGYKFKLGGGIGYRYVDVTERIGYDEEYSSGGVGFLLRGQGLTTLRDNLFILISVDARYDINGEPSNGNRKIRNPIDDSNVNLNLISFAFKIGMTYVIGE